MIIDISNYKVINTREIYIHDDIFENLNFDYATKVLDIFLLDYYQNRKKYSIRFFDVIGLKMSACDFWGASLNVLDFRYVEKENYTVIPKLLKKKEQGQQPPFEVLPDSDEYFEVCITFVSGDILIIACKRIEYIK